METTNARAGVVAVSSTARRTLQASEHRILLACGDLIAASVAVALAIWVWSITAGFPFTPAFLARRAQWFLAVPAWVLVLLPSHNVRTALSARRTTAALARGMALLLAVYLATYFYAPPRALPRLVALYILWEGALLVLAWRLWYLWSSSGIRSYTVMICLLWWMEPSIWEVLKTRSSRFIKESLLAQISLFKCPLKPRSGEIAPLWTHIFSLFLAFSKCTSAELLMKSLKGWSQCSRR